MTDALRYPIGPFRWPEKPLTTEQREGLIAQLAELPVQVRQAVAQLTEDQLDCSYRPGGWTARQVVHHLADSHLNAYVRFRLALTEALPLIKVYDQQRWAELPDARSAPVAPSIMLLEGLHARWVALLRSLAPEDFQRAFLHPERGRITLDQALALYAWHGRHHVAHLSLVRVQAENTAASGS
jgi:hypothetical protein